MLDPPSNQMPPSSWIFDFQFSQVNISISTSYYIFDMTAAPSGRHTPSRQRFCVSQNRGNDSLYQQVLIVWTGRLKRGKQKSWFYRYINGEQSSALRNMAL